MRFGILPSRDHKSYLSAEEARRRRRGGMPKRIPPSKLGPFAGDAIANVVMLKFAWLWRSLRDLLDAIIGAAIMISMMIGGPLLFQSFLCPTGTFLSGSGIGAGIAQFTPLLLASLGLSVLASSRFRREVPPVYQRNVLKFSLLFLLCMLPISFTASFSGYCLQEQTIFYREKPWSRQKIYSWTDVTEIDTICTQGRKGWNGIFVIDLRDGTIIDITGWPDRFVAAYPHIVKALEGHRFAFNSTHVDLRCNVPYIRFLVQPP